MNSADRIVDLLADLRAILDRAAASITGELYAGEAENARFAWNYAVKQMEAKVVELSEEMRQEEMRSG